jgi:hypothetical protein
MADADARLDDLYGLPLSEFITARDALAKELRAAGRKEEAAEVKAARKPSLAAWALNHAARRHPDEVAGLLEAGQALAGAQLAALEGDAGGLREAGRGLGAEVQRVAGRAAGFLENPSAVQKDRMAATLRAAAADEAGADLLRRGVLVEDLEPAGFGLEAAAGAVRPPPARRRTAPARTAEAAEIEAARRELRRAEAEADAAQTRAGRRAERAEAAARRAAEVHQEAEALRAEAEEAAGEATAARRRAEEAASRLADATGEPGEDAT